MAVDKGEAHPPNGPLLPDAGGNSQRDTDGDGYGNRCDGDLNNSGLVTTADFAILRSVLNQSASASPTAAAADLNGSGGPRTSGRHPAPAVPGLSRWLRRNQSLSCR